MIKKLTPEQKALIPVYLQKWLDVGYRTAPLDKTKAEKAIEFSYRLMGREMPQVIYAKSPMAGLMVASLRTESQLESQLRSQLESQLRSPDNWNMYYDFHYDYVLNVLFPEKRRGFALFLEWLEHAKELHKYYCYEGVCIAVEFPSEIHLKNGKTLHNTSGMALRYEDGYGMFAVEGESMTAEDFAFKFSKLGKHLQGTVE